MFSKQKSEENIGHLKNLIRSIDDYPKVGIVYRDITTIIKDKLAFLSEQAAIARRLGVKKNTIESQMFVTQNTVVTNVKTETPFYLRGYEAIEE